MLKISKSIASVTEGSSSPTYSDVLGCWPLLLLLLALLCSRGAAAAAGAGEPVASPLLSPSIERFSKVSTPSGKWPQRMTEFDQRLRTTLAVKLAASVGRNEPVGIDSSGWTT